MCLDNLTASLSKFLLQYFSQQSQRKIYILEENTAAIEADHVKDCYSRFENSENILFDTSLL